MTKQNIFIFILVAFSLSSLSQENMIKGEEAWSKRATNYENGIVDPTYVQAAIDAFEAEITENPNNIKAHAKLMEAYYFKGDFVAKDVATKKEIYDRGLVISRKAFGKLTQGKDSDDMKPKELADLIKDNPDAASVCFWTSVMWGLWGDNFGTFQAAKKGVAGKIRNYAEATNILDETGYDAGGYRMLGRLHTLAPKIPFFTGWINRDKAIKFLEKANSISTKEPLNRFYLAEALLKFENKRKAEALKILEELAGMEASDLNKVEDSSAIMKAKNLLMESK